jgi:hypothetical protein
MKHYTVTDNSEVPNDAENIKMATDGTITFMSDEGPVSDDGDEPCCDQCKAEQDATPESLSPRRKSPMEGY